jgi:hypothetical protein
VFVAALKKAVEFTRPVIVSTALEDGRCGASIGAFVVLNRDGWIVTAAHILDGITKVLEAQKAYNERAAKKARAEEISDAKERSRALKAVGFPEKDAIKDGSVWWGWDGASLTDVHILPEADLAVGRLERFDAANVKLYPDLRDPSNDTFTPGTSVVRTGYPFYPVKVSYHGANGFELTDLPKFFPIEGIVTRFIQQVPESVHGYFVGYVETSSPGLKGQSGGPLLDTNGAVCGVQSHTTHLDLGFAPAAPSGPKGAKEHQFLNVGRAVHPTTLIGFLSANGVAHSLATY